MAQRDCKYYNANCNNTDTSAAGVLVPEGIIHPVVSANKIC
jgi:hypothetical protein